VLNAVILGLETSPWVMARAGGLPTALDSLLLAVFVVEIVARVIVHRAAFFRDPWSLFDLAVVAVALVPAAGAFSVLRALRILRVLRVITLVPSLRRVVGALITALPGMGSIVLVGLAARGGWVERLGCCWVTHTFLPGVLLARGMGRQDCLGATMALRAGTLAEIGGLRGLADHLADDNELGRRVRARGLGVALAGSVPATTVAEGRLGALWRHELRWGRTIRALVPGAFAASAVQYPVAWALAAWAASGAWWGLGLVLAAWGVRAAAAMGVDRALGHGGTRVPVALLPVRDVLSVAVVGAAFLGRRVEWRGQVLRA